MELLQSTLEHETTRNLTNGLGDFQFCDESEKDVANEFETIQSQLKKILEKFLESNPYLSLNSISQRSGVAFTTLSRIMKNQGPRQGVSPHVVLQLVAYILKEYRVAHLIKVVEGPIGKYLNEHFGKFIFS